MNGVTTVVREQSTPHGDLGARSAESGPCGACLHLGWTLRHGVVRPCGCVPLATAEAHEAALRFRDQMMPRYQSERAPSHRRCRRTCPAWTLAETRGRLLVQRCDDCAARGAEIRDDEDATAEAVDFVAASAPDFLLGKTATLRCPSCHAEAGDPGHPGFRHCQLQPHWTDVTADGLTLTIDSESERVGNTGSDVMLECGGCGREFAVPDAFTVERC